MVSDIECCAALRSPFLLTVFCPSKSSLDIHPVFHFESLLFFHLHQELPQWNWTQKLIWDSSIKTGGSWSWGGRDGWDCLGGTDSSWNVQWRVEALLHPLLFWQGQGRDFTGRMTTCSHISCPVIPSSCRSPCKGSKQRMCHTSPEVMTIEAVDFYVDLNDGN